MPKVGILTFHWAANHGAVLQTYASFSYLTNVLGCDVEIIDYCPRHYEHTLLNALWRKHPLAILRQLRELHKERVIRDFRKHFKLSRRYYSNDELISAHLDYDILMTGSDQIWNAFHLLHGERKVTPVYYLNFGAPSTRKMSLSASFGCRELLSECQEIVAPLLRQFAAISVRERSGGDIVRNMGIADVSLTADPTSLLSAQECLQLCSSESPIGKGAVAKMILRRQSKKNRCLISAICTRIGGQNVHDVEFLSIPDWLAALRDSRMVVTNSFHCVMMCLKLHTEFLVVMEDNAMSGMNDRFHTLLGALGLQNRIITDASTLETMSQPIDFAFVDQRMETYAQSLKDYLQKNVF